jgi:glutamyl-tRNA synthetase
MQKRFINLIKMEAITQQLKCTMDLPKLYERYKKYLKGAKDGEVVTRFPPEPSGYLHIGHVKAVCLNYHFSKMYGGKMIMRFDDTNPANEKTEYKESILKDLETLGIVPDQMSNTSDYFEHILEKAEQFIKEGGAYCDCTDEETMKKERMEKVESKYRNTSVEENLKIWEGMKKGENKEYCLRAKINMASDNGCLRDPVIYRHCIIPHHATKDKYKVYPTYDFACPIIDSLEGVSHALRTSEYSDRNPLYNFMLKKLHLNNVKIQEYSRLSFEYTTLSKRKLNWFVKEGVVENWNDPRFPTVQGVLRRGMLVDTITEFMLEQGPSKNTNHMEWDKIWAINAKKIDKFAYRFTAISKEGAVNLKIENFDKDVLHTETIPLHPKIKDGNHKPLFKTENVILEKEDVQTLNVGDKFVLMHWGVFELTSKDLEKGQLTAKHLPDEKDFKTPPKLTWLTNSPDLQITCTIHDFGYLLKDKKLDTTKPFEESVNYESESHLDLFVEGFTRHLNKGDIVQFERRGFFIVDQKIINEDQKIHLVFNSIPNGKTKTMSGVKTK